MATAILVRDCIFWWVGNWALFTALDAAVVAAVLNLRARKEAAARAAEDSGETAAE